MKSNTLFCMGTVHIRVQQRSGRKYVTTIERDYYYVTTITWLPEIRLQQAFRSMKKELQCGGSVTYGGAIILQGDQRQRAAQFLVENKFVEKGRVLVHGA